MKKNVASQVIGVQMTTAADGTAFTGAVTVVVTVDGGTQSASGGTAPFHEGNGYHTYTPTQAETNGDQIGFTFTGSGAITVTVQVYTEFPQTGDSFARIGATGSGLTTLATAADLTTHDGKLDTADTAIDAIQTDLDNATDGLGALKALIDTVNTDLSNGTDGLGALKTLLDAIPTTKTDYSLSTAGILAIWHQATSAIVTAGSIGKHITDEVTSARMATLTDWIDGGRLDLLLDAIPTTAMRGTDSAALATDLTTAQAAITAIKAITDALGATAAARLALSAGQIIPFTVDTVTNGHTPLVTEFQADDITEPTADHYNGRVVIWTSGALLGQATSISDYAAVGGIGQFTVVAMTDAPANNDTGIII